VIAVIGDSNRALYRGGMVASTIEGKTAPSARAQRAGREKLIARLRLTAQLAFALLNVWIGFRFYLWVRALEQGGATIPARPAGVDGWLPIAGLMNLKAWITSGEAPLVHPAAAVLIAAFLTMSLLLRKSFCSWLCPIGTVSEYLWKVGRRIFGGLIDPPRWLDIPLRGLKYLLLAFFLFVALSLPASAIHAFMAAPYGIIADVKMLNFFRFIGSVSAAIILSLVVLSLFIRNFWCRYLCPYGALLGIVSLGSPVGIRRDAATCIDCTKCAKACPSRLPVDKLTRVRSAECSLCLSCVAVCPVRGALEAKVTARRAVPPWAIAAAIAVIFLGFVAAAKISGHWETAVPEAIYRELVPAAQSVGH
jgi:polyferredoxin